MAPPESRRVDCPCCHRRIVVRAGQVWPHRHHAASLRIVSAERDGAIVEQVGRDGERWGLSYRDLLAVYTLPKAQKRGSDD
jgi:hypothetical protein